MTEKSYQEAFERTDAVLTEVEMKNMNVSTMRSHMYESGVDLFKLPQDTPLWAVKFVESFLVYDQLVYDMQKDINKLSKVYAGDMNECT